MAAALLGGAAIGAAFGELLKAVLEVKDKASNFKNTLAYLRTILVKIDPLIKEMEQQNDELGRPKEELDSLIEEMEEGTKLVYRCSKIHRLNFLARIQYQDELAKLVVSLERFFRFDVPAQTSRDTKETLLKVTRILSAVRKLPLARTESATGSASDLDSMPLESDVCDTLPLQLNDEKEREADSTEEAAELERLAKPVLEDIASLVQKGSQGPIYMQAEAEIHKGRQDLQNKHEASGRLRRSIEFFGSRMGFTVSDSILFHENNSIAEDISKLEDAFKQLLSFFSKPVEPKHLFDCLTSSMRPSSGSPDHEGDPSGKKPSSSHHSESHENNNSADPVLCTLLNLIPSRIVSPLHYLAQQLVEAGQQQQLLRIYRDARSNWLEESIQIFGVEKLNNDDAQKLQVEILEAKIGSWIHIMPIAFKLFAGERNVCNLIFEGFDSLAEQCFSEVTTNNISMLLSIGEANAKIIKSPQNFHLLLDMCETMLQLHLEIETLFRGKACTEIREAVFRFTKQLAQMANEVFEDLEEVVEKDAIETAVTDGVHPLTSYMINFVRVLYDYQSTLKQLFQEFEGGDYSLQQASVTRRIMKALESKLDLKSKHSEAKDILGDDWVRLHSGIVQHHANQYIRNAWAKTLQCVSDKGIYVGMNNGVSRAVLKDRLKTFNDMFEELHRKQSQWKVPDAELQESLQLAVAMIVLPGYRTFLGRFRSFLKVKHIKYTPEDLEQMLGDFFEGKFMSQAKR
ncbi:exocyst complex component EXO70A1 isoform X3 [Arachis ipaensis]|uniref:exocyst complex component EXO70A1 isoform X3 n=1 Tax=Arachis ipaensis TaxID=130454 RepID=UPI000A2B97F9|nr:exocyst complex component EXO70A1 isoform X3 [Arachis ipaensis]